MYVTPLQIGLFALTGLACLVTGSSIQYIYEVFQKKGKLSFYITVLAVASITSLIQTVNNYINALMAPDTNADFVLYTVLNWVLMTQTSVLMLTNRLTILFMDRQSIKIKAYAPNAVMLIINILVCIFWSKANSSNGTDYDKHVNSLLEPIQISLWGALEFIINAIFLYNLHMSSQHHLFSKLNPLNRSCSFSIIFIMFMDLSSVLVFIFVGDLSSTVVKGCAYCCRIRIELVLLDNLIKTFSKSDGGQTSVMEAGATKQTSSNVMTTSMKTAEISKV